jgi:hypothetical protein
VLKDNHIPLVNGYECLTFGHKFADKEVANYYSHSHELIQELQKDEWQGGYVEISENSKLRDLLN